MVRRRDRAAAQDGQDAAPAGNVTGPHSALTSFLREQGITGGAVARRNRAAQTGQGGASATATAESSPGPITIDEETEEEPQQEVVTAGTSSRAATSDDMVIEVPVASSSAGKRKNAEAGPSGASKKSKKKKGGEDNDDDGDAMLSVPKPKPGKYDNRVPGAITKCAECGKRFTVTKYTVPNPTGGQLCSPCTTELTASGGAPKPAVKGPPAKKKAVKLNERELRTINTLQQIAIKVIGSNIVADNVDGLGDVGSNNLDKIAKIVCKHRALNETNLPLFLDVGHTELTLYDCTNVDHINLANIATFCPHLRKLELKLCGKLDDSVLEAWAQKFKELDFLALYAPYLVTTGQWIKYFESFGKRELAGFGLQQSTRFKDSCIEALVKNHPNLTHLQLSEIGSLNDASLELLAGLKNLRHLDISKAGTPQGSTLTDEGVVKLLENIGENLDSLVLDLNTELTDRVLIEGVKIHCPHLTQLSCIGLEGMQSTGVQALFTDWISPGLRYLNLHRCLTVDNEALAAILAHSGATLQHLDLHSVDDIESSALMKLPKACPALKVLDVSFVRDVDDFFLKECLEHMPEIAEIFVHGDNRVSDRCPRKRGVNIRGQENFLALDA